MTTQEAWENILNTHFRTDFMKQEIKRRGWKGVREAAVCLVLGATILLTGILLVRRVTEGWQNACLILEMVGGLVVLAGGVHYLHSSDDVLQTRVIDWIPKAASLLCRADCTLVAATPADAERCGFRSDLTFYLLRSAQGDRTLQSGVTLPDPKAEQVYVLTYHLEQLCVLAESCGALPLEVQDTLQRLFGSRGTPKPLPGATIDF